MAASTRLGDAVLRALDSELGSRGFNAAASGVYTRDLTPEVAGWLGAPLAEAKRGGAVDVDLMVGVRHAAVESLVDDSQTSATVFRPLYELFSPTQYRTWTFETGNIDAQARVVGEAVDEVAVPFMQSLTSSEGVERALRDWAFADIRRRRLPALVLLQRGADAATEAARRELSLLDEADEATRADYKSFVDRLLNRPH
jgi:hypothetical protein